MTGDTALSDRDRWIIVGGGLAAMAWFYLGVLRPWDLAHSFMVGAPIGRDFVNFWLGGHLALHDQLDLLIDPKGYNALISSMFGHDAPDNFVFSYPPHALLFLLPFGAMAFVPAVCLWTVLNLFCIFRAAEMMRPRHHIAALACVAPAVLTMAVYGHFGGFLGLLAIFILVEGKQRPLVAGLCLALMTVKPQLALMFGVFLLLVGYWRVVFISVPATLVFVAISVISFGLKPWENFITWTVPYHAELLSDFVLSQLKSTVSLYAGARMLGLPGWAAQIIQWLFSFVALAGAAIVYGRRGAEPRSIAIALSVVVLALPYSNSYDLAMAAPALTVALFAASPDRERLFLPFGPALLFWILPVCATVFGAAAWPVLPPILAAVVLLALAREAPGRPPVLAAFGAGWHEAKH